MRSLIGLELIDDDGRLTQEMELLRRAPSAEFKTRLEEHIRRVYAEVFQFTDPTKDDAKRVADAFRAYEPIGQRARMVTLFLGLCEAAGIIPEGIVRRTATPVSTGPGRKPLTTKRPVERPKTVPLTEHAADGVPFLPAPVSGLLSDLAKRGPGWTQPERDRWFRLFSDVVDYTYPIRDSIVTQSDIDEGDEDEVV